VQQLIVGAESFFVEDAKFLHENLANFSLGVAPGPAPSRDAYTSAHWSHDLPASLWWAGTPLRNLQERLRQGVRDPVDEGSCRQPCSRSGDINLCGSLLDAW
jgi:hypothetical protein